MNIQGSRIVIAGLLLLFTLISGVWLSQLGRPLNGMVFTIHKLIALGAVVFTCLIINQFRQVNPISPWTYLVIGISGLLFLLLFISGALLSAGKPASSAMLTIHRAAPLLAVIITGYCIYLLAYSRPVVQ